MKVRTGFVTNSSSASYTAVYTLESDGGDAAEFGVRASGGEFEYDGSKVHQGILDHIHVTSLSVDGLPFRCLPEGMALDRLIRSLIGNVSLGLYKEGHGCYDPFLTSGPRFFIVGEPLVYESREALEEAIGYVGEVVTWPPDADFVICCNKPQDIAQLRGWRASELAVHDIREAIEAAGIRLADPEIEYLGDDEDWRLMIDVQGRRDGGDVVWRLLSDLEDVGLWEPYVISEKEFSFFDPYGPAGAGTLSLMPGACEAFRATCSERGITMENLRFIRLHTKIMSFGDSAWHVDDREDDWCLDVREGTTDVRHNLIRRAGER